MNKRTKRAIGPPLGYLPFDVYPKQRFPLADAIHLFNFHTTQMRRAVKDFYDSEKEGSFWIAQNVLWPEIERRIRSGEITADGRQKWNLDSVIIPRNLLMKTVADIYSDTVSTLDGIVFYDVRLSEIPTSLVEDCAKPISTRGAGRPSVKGCAVEAAIMGQINSGKLTEDELRRMKADALSAYFDQEVSRNTCAQARKRVLSRIGKPNS